MSYTVGLYVMFGIVLLPFYMMLIAWFTGEPRQPETAILGVGYVVVLTVVVLFGIWFMGTILGLFVPG